MPEKQHAQRPRAPVRPRAVGGRRISRTSSRIQSARHQSSRRLSRIVRNVSAATRPSVIGERARRFILRFGDTRRPPTSIREMITVIRTRRPRVVALPSLSPSSRRASRVARSQKPPTLIASAGDPHSVREIHAAERTHRRAVGGSRDADRRGRGRCITSARRTRSSGHTGFAHMFEHVMFTGSGHVPYGMHDKYTEGVGGGNNGQTYNDWTQYYETDPSNYLETRALARVRSHGLSARLARRSEVQRAARHREERAAPELRQPAVRPRPRDPRPGDVSEGPSVFVADDRQHGRSDDRTVEDVKQFFRLYYAPNNATLAIVGDFDPSAGQGVDREVLRRHSARQGDRAPDGRSGRAHRRKATDVRGSRAGSARCTSQWPTVRRRTATTSTRSTCSSDILTGSRIARLTKALVYDKQSAASVSRFQSTNENVGEFDRHRHAAAGAHAHRARDADAIRSSRSSSATGRRRTSSSASRRGAAARLPRAACSRTSARRSSSAQRPDVLQRPESLVHASTIAKTQAVTAADVKRVANKYLGKRARGAEQRADRASRTWRRTPTRAPSSPIRSPRTTAEIKP